MRWCDVKRRAGLQGVQRKEGYSRLFASALSLLMARVATVLLLECDIPLLVERPHCARQPLASTFVGACGHCDIVLSSRSPDKCRYPLFACPLFKPARECSANLLAIVGAASSHKVPSTCVVSHYSAIGDTISCDAPKSAIGFRGKLSAPKSQRFLRFAIAMPIADPRNRAISETIESNAALRFKGAMESR